LTKYSVFTIKEVREVFDLDKMHLFEKDVPNLRVKTES